MKKCDKYYRQITTPKFDRKNFNSDEEIKPKTNQRQERRKAKESLRREIENYENNRTI